MWRQRKLSAPRVILRRLASLLATSLLVASFVTVFTASTPVNAAPAVWNGDQLTYEDNQYTETNADLPPSGAEGNTRYQWIDQDESPQKAHVIFFDHSNPQRAEEAQLVIFDYQPPDSYSNPSSPETIEVTIDLAGDPIEDGRVTSCSHSTMPNIGWLLCPLSNFIADGVDWMYKIVNDFMEVPIVSADSGTGIYDLWQVLLSIANICFAIVFLIIIYSHLTSVGFSTYNIKSMLPRLLIAAVLVNISFWICALAIDLSNVLGHSINAVLTNIRENMTTTADVDWSGMNLFIMSGGTAAAYLGFAASAGGSWTGLGFLLIAALAGVAFAIFIAFVILAARQAIITVLLILSPLAFVAFVLPSTQGWFDRWRKSFTTLLMFFPLFAVLFGGSGVAGAAIMNAADGRLHIVLIGMATQVVPLVLTPLLMQFSSGLLGRIAGLANNSGRGLTDRAKNWAHDHADARAAEKRAKWAEMKDKGQGKRWRNMPAMTGAWMDQSKRLREKRKGLNEDTLGNLADKTWQQRLNDGNSTGQLPSRFRHPRQRHRQADNRQLYQRYMDSHDTGEQARTHREDLESRASEQWQRNLSSGTGVYGDLKQRRRDTLHAKGKADALDQRMTAADQRDFDERVLSDPDYADIKLAKRDTIVDTKLAQFQASEVNELGERAYRAAFEVGSRGSSQLRDQNIRIENLKKESATVDNTLQKQADAAWESASISDDRIKALRFDEAAATDTHRRAAAEWNQVVEDIRLKGSSSQHATVTGTADAQRVRLAADTIRTETDAAIRVEKAASDIKTTYESKAQAKYIESAEGKIISRTSQAAQDTLAGVQAEETAIVQEWRTKKGAENLTGQEARIATELRGADVTKRVYTRRLEQASDVTAEEYAEMVNEDANIPGTSKDIVKTSAGIAGHRGEMMARATAHHTIVNAAGKATEAATTLFSQVREDVLLGDEVKIGNQIMPGLDNPAILDEPPEHLAALGSSIAKRHHMTSHIKLWDQMSKLRQAAQAEYESATTDAAREAAEAKISKVKDLQQQVMNDKTKTPFGVGDEDQGSANVGNYTNDIFENTRQRIMSHLSVEKLAGMDPDDLRMIYEMARSGKLNQAEMAKIAVTYKQWENHPLHGSSLQDKHRVMLDPMYQHAMDGRHGSQYTDADDPAKPYDYRYKQIENPGFQASPPRTASGRLRDEFDKL